jgi:hypothetical protein
MSGIATDCDCMGFEICHHRVHISVSRIYCTNAHVETRPRRPFNDDP